MVLPRPFSRVRTLLLAAALAAFITYSFLRWQRIFYAEQAQSTATKAAPSNEPAVVLTKPEGHISFWRQFQPLLDTYQPRCEPPLRLEMAPSVRFEQASPAFRPEVLDMLDDHVETMKQAHTGGLVSTAGGEYLPVLVISLRMLRRTGSELPLEVFLANEDEYETYICDVVLPSLNARCVVLSHVLDAVPKIMDIQKYQFKLFAMMFSSFEEILFLDADAFPLHQPETLFENEPFKSKKMVTWPDFWATTISPYYYEISSQPMPSNTIRQSSESGEVLLSKKAHMKTLLLSVYYNFWGPEYYYPLLSQGASGEGDKETFVAAALALGESYYQVSEPICAIGHGTEGGLAGSAMVQFDPVEDYALTQKGEWRVHGSKAPAPRAFFIHANFPKFNPATVFEKQAVNPAFADDGSYTRAWTIPQEVIGKFSTDVEKHFWKEILWTGCELENKFSSWKGHKGICAGVKKYWNAIYMDKKSPKI
ncbi:putative alpha-1,2-mannosyltransferase (Mnn2) [Aspergillus nomiae NRRL 13137]|uniref:Putative alpha-1,2-mannosyltransferase (Mnn2) n=1 Tax=Aspergillus nomiae NRRL (strain ATCC 15546 / NRRL 13137 / CBS 260.88 / M93) TaxID=1509407 RepID=A0A0L1IQI0_ASPN3|nr:putative alpha-1,2-mannosyltransferase (Mnn2) [Aspergillus nomiae NRRL 13137]KNG81851.1 putative alpha-1,2-mannosyltransferase (Mnn2) [Aspergillus nomiae NRRL 13137]